jgi:hypothetical protein
LIVKSCHWLDRVDLFVTLANYLTFDSGMLSKVIYLFRISRCFKRLTIYTLVVVVSSEVTRFYINRFSQIIATTLLLRKHYNSFTLLLLLLLDCTLSTSA